MNRVLFDYLMLNIDNSKNLDDAFDLFCTFGSFPVLVEEYYAKTMNTTRMTDPRFKGYDLENGVEVKYARRGNRGSIMVNNMTHKCMAKKIAFLIDDPKHGRIYELIITPAELLDVLQLDTMPKYVVFSDKLFNTLRDKISILRTY